MAKQRRLGRGLEALLSQGPQESGWDSAAEQPPEVRPEAAGLTWVGVYEIDRNPFQPRHDFDDEEIQQLAESINEHGMIQPIVVRRAGERFELVSGERRWRAATVAGWEKVHAQVWDVDDRRMTELAIVENIQRKDLNALEKAASFQSYLQQYQCTQEELASRLKVDRSTIANLIRLLELPDQVKQCLNEGSITPGHARALLTLGDAERQVAYCERVRREALSVRAIEKLVKQAVSENGELGLQLASRRRRSQGTSDDQLAALEQELRMALGSQVQIRESGTGRGKIVISFRNHEEFERLRSLLGGSGATRQAA